MSQAKISRSKWLIFQPGEDVDTLAGSPGITATGTRTVSLKTMKAGARRGIARRGTMARAIQFVQS